MTSDRSTQPPEDGSSGGEDATARDDPRWERYLEYCAELTLRGLPSPSFSDWVVQSEEGY